LIEAEDCSTPVGYVGKLRPHRRIAPRRLSSHS